mgnify:CR=1 FL=1
MDGGDDGRFAGKDSLVLITGMRSECEAQLTISSRRNAHLRDDTHRGFLELARRVVLLKTLERTLEVSVGRIPHPTMLKNLLMGMPGASVTQYKDQVVDETGHTRKSRWKA